MATDIVFDAVSAGTGTSMTHSVTTGGSGRIVLLFIAAENDQVDLANLPTYGGDVMTQVFYIPTAFQRCYCFYLANPPTGSQTINITYVLGGTLSKNIAISYTGVDSSNPVRTEQTDNDAPLTITFGDATSGDLQVAMVGVHDDTGVDDISWTNGETERLQHGADFDGARISVADLDPDTSTTMSSSAVEDQENMGGVPLVPAVARLAPFVDLLNNLYMDRAAGRTIMLTAEGRELPIEQIATNKWGYADGPLLPTCERYDNLAQDSSAFYTEAVEINPRGTVRITSQSESMFQNILGKLARR